MQRQETRIPEMHRGCQSPASSALSDNSKSPQDAAIRYEPAAAVKN
jgi:hypothetical protein